MTYINVKIPNNVVTIFLPPFTTTGQVNISVENRVTPDGEVRVIPGGEVRVVGYDITSYPEIVAIKLPNNVISVSVPS